MRRVSCGAGIWRVRWGGLQCKMKKESLGRNDEAFQVGCSRVFNHVQDLLGLGPVLFLLESLECL